MRVIQYLLSHLIFYYFRISVLDSPVPQIGKITILRVVTKSLARHMDKHCIVGKEEVLHRFLLFPKAFVPLRRVHGSLTCRESFCTPGFLHSHPLDTISLQIKHGMGIH